MGFSTVLQVKIPAKSRGPMPLWALDGGTWRSKKQSRRNGSRYAQYRSL
jgi:hypothetical protein